MQDAKGQEDDPEEDEEEAKAQAAATAAAEAAASAETNALVARITELEDEGVRKDLVAARIPADHHDGLLALKRKDEELYASAVENLTPTAPAVQPPIGRTGATAVTGANSAEQILAEAESKGFSYGNKLTVFLAANYPDRVADVAAVARTQFLAQAKAQTQPN